MLQSDYGQSSGRSAFNMVTLNHMHQFTILNKATPEKADRALSVPSVYVRHRRQIRQSWWSGDLVFIILCTAIGPGLAVPAEQPQTEFIITRVVPLDSSCLVTSSGVFNSLKPFSVSSSFIGITNSAGYIFSFLNNANLVKSSFIDQFPVRIPDHEPSF